MPSIRSHLPGWTFIRFSSTPSRLNRISFTRELLPLPDTPVTTVKVPRGNSTSMWRRLFSAAPMTFRHLPLPGRRVSGTGIFFLPERYCPVRLLGLAMTSSGVPAATTSPPWMPAPGPMSMR